MVTQIFNILLSPVLDGCAGYVSKRVKDSWGTLMRNWSTATESNGCGAIEGQMENMPNEDGGSSGVRGIKKISAIREGVGEGVMESFIGFIWCIKRGRIMKDIIWIIRSVARWDQIWVTSNLLRKTGKGRITETEAAMGLVKSRGDPDCPLRGDINNG
jgi:hypothetical protein